MGLELPSYYPTEYVPMVRAADRWALFHDTSLSIFDRLPEWIVLQRWLLARLDHQHLNDMRLLAGARLEFHRSSGIWELAPGLKPHLPELSGIEMLFPWFAGLLGAKEHIPMLLSMLKAYPMLAVVRACLAGLVLMDHADAAEACLEAAKFLQQDQDGLGDEALYAVAVIAKRSGATGSPDTLPPPKYRHTRLGRAIAIGDIIRAGIPIASGKQFQAQLGRLVDLSTPYDHYPSQIGTLMPSKVLLDKSDLVQFSERQEGVWLMRRTACREHYEQGGLEATKRYLANQFPKPGQKGMPMTLAVQQFAGRGWDRASIDALLSTITPHHDPHDLEVALELDLPLRLPLGVVEAIFENLISQFPLYHDYYHRYAVQLLLRSKDCDARAAELYAKGDALRAQWKTQWVAGLQIPMMALTIPEEENRPGGQLG